MTKAMQLRIVLSALMLTASACSSAPVPTQTSGVPLSCGDVRWSNLHEEKALTDAQIVLVGDGGAQTPTEVPGFPKQVEPSASSADDTVLAALVDSLAQVMPGVQTVVGPPLASADALGDRPDPGQYVVYAGATLVTADFAGQCATSGNLPIEGQLQTWSTEVQGALECALDQAPPEGSLGAIASKYCR